MGLVIVKKNQNCDCPKDDNGMCFCDRAAAGLIPLEDIMRKLYIHGPTREVTREQLQRDKTRTRFEVPVSAARQIMLTQDRFVCPDEYHTMMRDNLRTVSTYVDSADPADHALGNSLGIPPIGVRKVCPALLSDKTISDEIDKAIKFTHELARKQQAIDFSTADYTPVQKALNLSLHTVRKQYRLRKTDRMMPYHYEHIITVCNSGSEPINTLGYTTTILEGIAHAYKSSQLGNCRLVGSSMRYLYGTNLIYESDRGGVLLWPDERTMTRVIVNIGDAIWKTDYIGFEVKSFLDRAISALLTSATPREFDYDGNHKGQRIGDAAVYIDSLADVVSTMYNAFARLSNEQLEDERERAEAGESYVMEMLMMLAQLDDKRISGLFQVLLDAANLFLLDENTKATVLLLKTHILASAQDIVKYRSRKGKFVRRLMSRSKVIHELWQRKVAPFDIDNLPYTGNMKRVYLMEVVAAANAALNKKTIKCFTDRTKGSKLRNAPRRHAAGSNRVWSEVRTNVKVDVGPGLTVEPGQVDLIEVRQLRAIATVATEGPHMDRCYRLEFQNRELKVFRSVESSSSDEGSASTDTRPSARRQGETAWESGLHVTSEALNCILRGHCDGSSTRWVLSGLLRGFITVHSSSTASFIPAGSKRDDDKFPVVDAPLPAFLVAEMAAIVKDDAKDVWLVASEAHDALAMRVLFSDGRFHVTHGPVPNGEVLSGRLANGIVIS